MSAELLAERALAAGRGEVRLALGELSDYLLERGVLARPLPPDRARAAAALARALGVALLAEDQIVGYYRRIVAGALPLVLGVAGNSSFVRLDAGEELIVFFAHPPFAPRLHRSALAKLGALADARLRLV